MKTISTRTLAVLIIVVFTAVLLCACGGSSVTGTWKLASVEGSGSGELTSSIAMIESMGGSITLKFTGDTVTMSYSVLGMSESQEFSYKIDGSKLIIDDEACEYSVSNSKLTLSKDGAKIVFDKK